ncbi:FAD-binding dehydrogenase [Rhodococcus sp. 06-412-2C]|uniref:FAD-dependent oxidoreductase n=1 Tax=unclassified Rhodococcus (in: high G+C Gram-positive bacteria) TaxID=192944 RepID=UPI000B9B4EEF|nr:MULTISPECIES: FAD-dependent oxidoreductase [unclassified Rhodococcus (in: high G+C Gram-positive bacteria)]OZC87143.1 FAD-binding dehydrogenase [Rhodococcus sp. 06-412-2C]OZD00829.1 FAD-binding dehydrogenase [Rhodococcus sp. 06-412-2B]
MSNIITCDLLVIGAGAGGLAAAVTAAHSGAKVIVAEKADVCGGATAWSGGWMWAPRNPLAVSDGVDEDIELPRTYLEHRLGENFDCVSVDAFLRNAPEMVRFFHDETRLQFVAGKNIADIHGATPGAGTGHRSVAPQPIDAYRIPPHVRKLLRWQLYETSFLGMGIMAGADLQAFLHATRSPRAFGHSAWRVTRHLVDLVAARKSMQLVNGTALVARLLASADERGVEIRVSSPARTLVTSEAGQVTGAILDSPDGPVTVRSARGVVLATGGFPGNIDMRRRYFPRTPTGREHWTLAPETTTGDGIALAESVGGRLDTGLASPVAYCPVSLVPYRSGRTGVFPHILDRGKPGLIGVLASGRRFVNEADGYHDYTTAMLEQVPDGDEVCSWLVCDHRFQRLYPLGMSKPRPIPVWPYLRSGYLKKGRTVADLAVACGIDPAGLQATVASFNAHAELGTDPEFGRGATLFNRGSGDPDNPYPNPTLAPLKEGPFYAVKVVPGSFGTFAGVSTDSSSRVLDKSLRPVPGLYAVGSDQSSVMGGHYPAGGINIGPAMTFGYIAARHATGEHLDGR